MTCSVLEVHAKGYLMGKVGVQGAFIHIEMASEPVWIHVQKKISGSKVLTE